MSENSPILLWFRRDLRLSDHPALDAACATGRPVIPVFINDDVVENTGAAAKMRWGMSIAAQAAALHDKGSRLILRRGDALAVLRELIKETGAGSVWWSRLYDPACKDRDTAVKSALTDDGIDAHSHAGHLLFEPWTVKTGSGGFYKVYTPMWKNVRDRQLPDSLAAPSAIPAPDQWPDSDDLDDWQMSAAMQRGADILRPWCTVGEEAAIQRLATFVQHRVADYQKNRDIPGMKHGTSGLSENLTYGEISPLTCWHAGWRAMDRAGTGAETFLKELVWREFAYHLIYHTPRIVDRNWREEWDGFDWNTDERLAEVKAWKQGRTGIRFVDAAMREMYVTGTMHNRGRMIVASYLTKHLQCDWRIGQRWFADCLIDWDPASNAMGWQWSAGSGPDATPYFRVFNPVTQLDKFDGDRDYVRAWLAEGYADPSDTALSYFDAIPQRWGMSPDDSYPDPIVAADDGRKAALDAYERFKNG
ncbi:deoxyribodipyrimidine photolyase [Loktanella sp. 3ANDIMAR09]|uniref:cryptochrome/photolyase family protein n=1 Tax=Loktanella sp. 3ANDIMAR09 TaxID=1225657 RepID=UPI000701753E|nr:deoxyribodipyrimidine photo-lyase [Loktanella sp. 3ANDIMAR09]KQI69722.1 deoxyribodipyrimidine photolyase [Loktanella sp. 3ANDIMAR09]